LLDIVANEELQALASAGIVYGRYERERKENVRKMKVAQRGERSCEARC